MNLMNFTNLANEANLITLLEGFKDKLLYNEINCCRVAIVNEFYPDTMEVQVIIVNKLITEIDANGSQIMEDYAPITAKVCYANNGMSFPLKKGDCGIILFSDREIESWYINGEINQLAYNRAHALTDAIFIAGLFAQPNIANAQYIQDCLHIFYETKGIKITSTGIEIDGDTIINGNLTVNGQITATGDIISNGLSFLNHKHSGVTTGSGKTGTPTT